MPTVIGTWDRSFFFVPEQPTNADSHHISEGLKLVVEHVTAVGLDLRDCCPVKLDPNPSEPA
ncbi:MAG TPA: hypothetical protein VNH65_20270 [Candidatus Acidoferrum sp.]|nr:hypothetical protein [Candidatus Acidoferrum sp.]